jgi:multidrug efflux system membrane fusion protein
MNDVDRRADSPSVHPDELRSPLGSRAKSLLIVLLCLGLLGGLGWYFSHRNAQNGPPNGGFGGGRGRPSATVAFAVAARADVPIKVEALGTVTPIATAVVRPQVSGVINDIYYQEGQTVKSGQPLVQIDPRPFQLAIDQAQAQLARDDAELDNARVILERNRTLLAQDSIAKQDVETQEATVKQLIGVVAADLAAIATARLNLTYSKVVAPISGRIGLRPVDLGNYVTAGDASGVATITQLQPIDVVFTLPADNVIPVEKRLAAGAQLPTAVLDRTRTQELGMGQFLTLDNQIDPQTGTVRAKARFDNPDGVLFPNQFVNVQLQLDTVKQAIVVPAAAIRHGPQGEFVYVIAQDNTAHVREVKTGVALDDRASVTTGLEVGERVVTEGGDRLADGSTVRLPGQQRPDGAPGGGNRKWNGSQGGQQNAQGQRRHRNGAQDAPAASGAQQGQPASGDSQQSEQAAAQGQGGERRRSHRAAAQDAG